MPALTGQHVRDVVLTAVEIVTTLDDGVWRSLGDPDGPKRVQAGVRALVDRYLDGIGISLAIVLAAVGTRG
jgi:hypothetical protein